MLTGIASGPVQFEVATAPRPADSGWDEQSVVVMHLAAPLFAASPTVMDAGPMGQVFEPATPGLHQVKVLARGRDGQYDANLLPDAEPAEQYRVVTIATDS